MKKQKRLTPLQNLKYAAKQAVKVVSSPKTKKAVFSGLRKTDRVLKGIRHEIIKEIG